MFIFKKSFYALVALLISVQPATAQTVELTLSPDHSFMVEGTSNVRDWYGDVTRIDARFHLNPERLESLSGLQADDFGSLELRMPVEMIESDGRRLTRNIHDYLKKDDHPEILFELDRILSVENSADGSTALIRAAGVVTAAGGNHDVEMEVRAELDNGTLILRGSQPLNMTDFGISPPTAMLGSIRANDPVIVNFQLRFQR